METKSVTERGAHRFGLRRVKLAAAALLVVSSAALAADWPQFGHDAGRTGFTTEALTLPLQTQWTFVPKHPPMPAWPDPVREYNLMDFDYAFQSVIGGERVFFGSSADHHVYALDAKSGKVIWTFCTDGPVRFAPAVWQEQVLAASDDGCIYCLSAKDGRLLWKKRIGPLPDKIIGNGQMVSRWLLRSGLAVADGLVYASAGMWPLEKTFMCALKVEDGAEVWKTEPPDFAPQGYFALNTHFLYVPAGRAPMWVMGRDGGNAHPIHPFGRSAPVARDDVVLTGPQTHSANENLPIAGAPAFGSRATSIWAWTPGMERVIKPAVGGRTVSAFGAEGCYLAGSGRLGAYDFGLNAKWEVEGPQRAFAIIVSDKTIVVGGESEVRFYSTDGGKDLGATPVEGEARGLAVAEGCLFVSLNSGRIVCLGPGKVKPAVIADTAVAPLASRAASKKVAAILKDNPGIGQGFCLTVGADADVASELARQSPLNIYCVDPDAAKVSAARTSLSAAGLYGVRVTVFHVPGDTLPFPDYFANLVVATDSLGVSPSELARILRPCGGVAYHGGTKTVRGPLDGAADWTQEYANAGNSASSGDRLVTWPLRLLWFGEPGPNVAMNRHLRGSAPVTSYGRMFVLGQHCLTAVDAYNGAQLWRLAMPSAQRRVTDILGGCLASDRDAVYLATGGLCLRLDADTGDAVATYRLPVSRASLSLRQAQTISLGDGNELAMKSLDAGIELTLVTKDATVANPEPGQYPVRGDAWELFFDFRQEAQRAVLYGPGVCHAIVTPAGPNRPSACWTNGPWAQWTNLKVEGAPVADGSKTVVKIGWDDIAKVVGSKPATFAFGVILNASDDGVTRNRRSYKFATRESYRIADFPCTVALDVSGPEPAASPLDKLGPVENMTWGQLTVLNNTVIGSVIEQTDTPDTLKFGWDFASEGKDFTGPGIVEVLDSVGAGSGTRCIFALQKDDGTERWHYMAENLIPHTGVCVVDNRVYILDRPPLNLTAAERRRGEPPAGTAALVVLDLESGEKIGVVTNDLSDYGSLRGGYGTVVASSLSGMAAFDAKNMNKLWSVSANQPMHHCSAFLRAPVITTTWIYDEPFAYDLRTGKQRLLDPAKPDQPWTWGNFRGCGTVSGSDAMLFFRNSNPSMLDTSGAPTLYNLAGIRPGCFINMIPACGLMLMPEASSGCGCAYNFQTTVALLSAGAAE